MTDRAHFNKHYGWLVNVNVIAKYFTKDWDYVFKLNVVYFLNILTFVVDEKKVEYKEQLEQMRQAKIR